MFKPFHGSDQQHTRYILNHTVHGDVESSLPHSCWQIESWEDPGRAQSKLRLQWGHLHGRWKGIGSREAGWEPWWNRKRCMLEESVYPTRDSQADRKLLSSPGEKSMDWINIGFPYISFLLLVVGLGIRNYLWAWTIPFWVPYVLVMPV